MKNYFKHKMRGKSPATIAGMIIFGIIAITGLAILFGFVIMWLWNWLMPDLFDLPIVTYWQAVGLFILLKILLGGCGSGSGSRSNKDSNSCDSNGKKGKKKSDFSKWEHYDQFWKEKGESEYAAYIEGLNDSSHESSTKKSEDSSNGTHETENSKVE